MGQRHSRPHSTAPRRDPGAPCDRRGQPCPMAADLGTHRHAQILPTGWDSEASAWQEVGVISQSKLVSWATNRQPAKACFVPLRGTGDSTSKGGAGLGAGLGDESLGRQKGTFSPHWHNSLPSSPPAVGAAGHCEALSAAAAPWLLLGRHPALSRAGELGAAPGLGNSSVSRAFIQ